MSRPANGRFELTRGFNEDFIPASAGFPGPTRTSLPAAPKERRTTKVTSTFNAETGELVIRLGFCSPEVERTVLNRLIGDAKPKGLRLVTLCIESEVASELASYAFLTRNKFSRNIGKEGVGNEGELSGQLVFEKRMEE